ncbi:MAG: hypothetical protein FD163_1615 [Hyphomonadaceae bacterium]|nr:MAG: hypothetical protein FD128_326 [Hyphomonadaceae bacterium]KAF0184918.1 MAG: hypothetical protein FD163_1615 [Hyphomonadaceae bacterium]
MLRARILLFCRMAIFTVFLRAINVGGTGKLPMADLKTICHELGFEKVTTYIQSGNVVIEADQNPSEIKEKLETKLCKYLGKPIGVMVRTAAELEAILKNNPFNDKPPNRVIVILLDAMPSNPLENIKHQKDEIIAIGKREIYVHYGEGMGSSKLIIPAAKIGTGRNINTMSKMLDLATNMETQK